MIPYKLEWVKVGLNLVGLVAYSLLERWLGRTDKVKANSLIDFVVSIIQSAINGLLKLKKSE